MYERYSYFWIMAFSLPILLVWMTCTAGKCWVCLLFTLRRSVVFLRARAYMISRVYAIARPSVRLSVTGVDHTKTVEVMTGGVK